MADADLGPAHPTSVVSVVVVGEGGVFTGSFPRD